ncbi:MAG: response regulator, partial [Saprospiraceae bacterium]
MNCLIVDDNKMARVTLNQLATQIEDLEIIGEFSSGMEVYNFLKARQVDIIFLDIEM